MVWNTGCTKDHLTPFSHFAGAQFCPSGKGEECQLIHMLGHCHIGSLGMQMWNMSAAGLLTPGGQGSRSARLA